MVAGAKMSKFVKLIFSHRGMLCPSSVKLSLEIISELEAQKPLLIEERTACAFSMDSLQT